MPFDGKTVSETALRLMKAKAYLEEKGWCSDGPSNDDGNVCVVAAINLSGRPASVQIIKVFGDANEIEGGIGPWNDAPGRTLEDILSAFDRAIAYAMERGE